MPGEQNNQTKLAEIEELLASYKNSLKTKRWMRLGIFSPKRLLCEVEIAESILASDLEDTAKIARLRAWAGAQGARFINFANDDANALRESIFNAAKALPKIYAEDRNENKAKQKPESFIAKMKSRIKNKKWFERKNFFDRYSERITDLEYENNESLSRETNSQIIDNILYSASEDVLKIAEEHHFDEDASIFSEALKTHERIETETLDSIARDIENYTQSRHYRVSTHLSYILKSQSKMINRLTSVLLDEIKHIKNGTPASIDSLSNEWKTLYAKKYKEGKIKKYTQAGCAHAYYRASIERIALLLNELENCINSILGNMHYLLTMQELHTSKAELYALFHKYQSITTTLFNEILESEYALEYPEDIRLGGLNNWAYHRLNNEKPNIIEVMLSKDDSSKVRAEKLNRQACNTLVRIQRALWDLRPVFDNFINEECSLNGDRYIIEDNTLWDQFRLIDTNFSAVDDIMPYAAEHNLVSYTGRDPNSFWFLALISYIPKLANDCNRIVQNKCLEQIDNIKLLTYRSPISAFMYSNELSISEEIAALNEANQKDFASHLKVTSPSFDEIRHVIKSIPINVLIDGSKMIGSKLATTILILFYSGLNPIICLPDVFENRENAQSEYFIKMTLANILLHSIRQSYDYWNYLYDSRKSGLYQHLASLSNIIYTYIPNDEITSTLSHVNKIYELNSYSTNIAITSEIVDIVQQCLQESGILEVPDQYISIKLKEVYPWDISKPLALSQLRSSFITPIDWVNKVLKCLKTIGADNCYDVIKSHIDTVQMNYNSTHAFEDKKMFSHEMEDGVIEYAFSTRSDSLFLEELESLKNLLSLLAGHSYNIDSFIEENLTGIPFTLADLEDEFINSLYIVRNGLSELGNLFVLIHKHIKEQSSPINKIQKNCKKGRDAAERGLNKVKEAEEAQIENFSWFSFFCPCASIPIDDDDEIEDTLPVYN